jgi:hypothetical protein
MRKYLVLCVLFFSCKEEYNIEKLKTNTNYLVFRDSESKEGFFVKNFNLSSKNLTHVGFLLFTNNKWNVFHAIDKKEGNCIVVDKWDDFVKKDNNKTLKIQVLKINSISKTLLLHKIDSVQKLNLSFDFNFEKVVKNKTYCSKFVCQLLNELNPLLYNFNFQKKRLNNIEAAYLNKEILEYYPVDIFFRNKYLEKVTLYKND